MKLEDLAIRVFEATEAENSGGAAPKTSTARSPVLRTPPQD